MKGPNSQLWTTDQAAEFLGYVPRTLAEKRSRGDGPPYLKLSRRCVRYDPAAVRAWLAERTQIGTFEDKRRAA